MGILRARLINFFHLHQRPRRRPSPRPYRPILEYLEDRTVPAVMGSPVAPMMGTAPLAAFAIARPNLPTVNSTATVNLAVNMTGVAGLNASANQHVTTSAGVAGLNASANLSVTASVVQQNTSSAFTQALDAVFAQVGPTVAGGLGLTTGTATTTGLNGILNSLDTVMANGGLTAQNLATATLGLTTGTTVNAGTGTIGTVSQGLAGGTTPVGGATPVGGTSAVGATSPLSFGSLGGIGPATATLSPTSTPTTRAVPLGIGSADTTTGIAGPA